MAGPYGPRRVTYADYTASGRASTPRGLIRDEVLPPLRNTHTESCGTGLQTTRLARGRAHQRSMRASAVDDETVVVFCGSGATGCRRQS